MPASAFPPALLDVLRSARSVVALTGAGISAESGVPTFRDALTGLWARYDPQKLATPEAFAADPQLVWNWYKWRQELIAETRPNPGHLALAALELKVPSMIVVTQNIDGLHEMAGSSQVIEVHGNIWRTRCTVERKTLPRERSAARLRSDLPSCPDCGGLLRPDVVWFGEALPEGAFEQAMDAVRGAGVVLSVGTSGIVYPAAALPGLASDSGALTIEVNLNRTPLSAGMDYVLSGPSGEVLPALLSAAWPEARVPEMPTS